MSAASPLSVPPAILARLRAATRALALTGAGISAESGIPTFRDLGTGLWTQYSLEDFATPRGWRRNPQLVWGWYAHRRRLVQRVEPNAGHRALAALADFYPQFTLATQNVDGLHARAGSRDVLELHGSLFRFKCSADDDPVDYQDPGDADPASLEALERGDVPDVPACPRCGALVRPDVVWFEEALPEAPFRRAEEATRVCDVCFVVGTSALVWPAAGLPLMARSRGALLVEINPEATDLTDRADLSLRGPAGVILPELVKLIREER